MNEEQLLKAIMDNPQEFGKVYELFHSRIFGYVYRRTTDYDIANDITAETFLKAFVNIEKFRWRGVSILYWLYQIATNELNRYFNSKKYKPASLSRMQEEYGIDISEHSNAETRLIQTQDDLDKHQEFSRMNEAVKKLDVKYQDVISLRYFEQRSVKEIAIILNKKEGTIKSLLSRGIDKIKEHLKSNL